MDSAEERRGREEPKGFGTTRENGHRRGEEWEGGEVEECAENEIDRDK